MQNKHEPTKVHEYVEVELIPLPYPGFQTGFQTVVLPGPRVRALSIRTSGLDPGNEGG